MSIILGLPESLSCDILGNWCSINELKELDSAFCSWRRKLFITLLCHSHLFSRTSSNVETVLSVWLINWLVIRKVKLTRLSFIVSRHGLNAKRLHTGEIICLEFNYPRQQRSQLWFDGQLTVQEIIDLVDACPKLVELRVSDLRNFFATLPKLKTSILNQLKHLAVEKCANFDHNGSSMSFIATHCVCLESFRMDGIRMADMDSMLKNCKYLTKIELLGSTSVATSFFETVAEHCVHIKELKIHNNIVVGSQFTLELVIKVLKNCIEMVNFELFSDSWVYFHYTVHSYQCINTDNIYSTSGNNGSGKVVKSLLLGDEMNTLNMTDLFTSIHGFDRISFENGAVPSTDTLTCMVHNNCTTLTELHMGGLNVDPEFIKLLMKQCTKLSKLTVVFAYVSDIPLREAIADNIVYIGNSLVELNLSVLFGISHFDLLRFILQHCVKLRIFTVSGGGRADEVQLSALKHAFPNVNLTWN